MMKKNFLALSEEYIRMKIVFWGFVIQAGKPIFDKTVLMTAGIMNFLCNRQLYLVNKHKEWSCV